MFCRSIDRLNSPAKFDVTFAPLNTGPAFRPSDCQVGLFRAKKHRNWIAPLRCQRKV